jgi:hypothetical protein
LNVVFGLELDDIALQSLDLGLIRRLLIPDREIPS